LRYTSTSSPRSTPTLEIVVSTGAKLEIHPLPPEGVVRIGLLEQGATSLAEAMQRAVSFADVSALIQQGFAKQFKLDQVNGRLFVNNVAMGVYGAIVQSPAYRDHKVIPDASGQKDRGENPAFLENKEPITTDG
jgi:hypothetical protein